ncbi:Methionine aminotransferase [Dyadobacter sp. CECT 9275]|uniref:Methionine aminotransferase n=1 Tax=Dyadobacter helix TaxID=2822344 RepID=A0A916NCJ4_9BACT|nr:methionine aminotransferase [Dyadobacter sp. CECT 9275]CAG5004855.1 Methionine aminotransferase [Dyadobacter sp. CECT 9275]
MPHSATSFTSKLPEVGTTIFTKMSALAGAFDAINLAQGFPEFDCAPGLQALVSKYMKLGKNQYAPMAGVSALREAITQKINTYNHCSYDPDLEITITSGATEALYVAISAVVRPGDEVIVFEPAYDSYVPAIRMSGGVPVYVTLDPRFQKIDWEQVSTRISTRTRAIIVNTPNNPSGYVWTREDLLQLDTLASRHDLIVISDEVYEHIIFDGRKHLSVSSVKSLAERSFICGSFGKTFHITGWKLGYCLATAAFMVEFRKIHQFMVFSVITPFQFAIAEFLNEPEHYLELSAFYQRKRDLFNDALKATGFDIRPTEGSFFQNAGYAGLSEENDLALAERLTREIGVASIPVSSFYAAPVSYKVLRFCFAKNDDTLLKAAERLGKISWQ